MPKFRQTTDRQRADLVAEARATLHRKLRDIVEDMTNSSIANYAERFVDTARAILTRQYADDPALAVRELSEMVGRVSMMEAPHYARAVAAYEACAAAVASVVP